MDLLIRYAMSFVGTPYIWGGSHPAQGLDCSGLVQIILQSAGIDPPGDQTAQGLYDYFDKNGSYTVGPGAIAFFGKSALKVTHVGFCVDQYRMIHASGGDSTCRTVDDAISMGAFVKMTLIKYRPDLVAVIKPNYVSIGLGGYK